MPILKKNKPIFLIDIAVPRDIAPDVNDLEMFTYMTLMIYKMW